MAQVIKVRLVKDEWTPMFKKLQPRKVEKILGNAGKKVSDRVVKNMRNSLSQKGLIWEGQLYDSIISRRRGNISRVTMRNYGFALDHMEPHFVSLKPGRKISRWAKDKFGLPQRQLPRAIYVRPHPWLRNPIAQALRNTDRIVKQEITNYFKR